LLTFASSFSLFVHNFSAEKYVKEEFVTWPGVVINTILASSPTTSSTFSLSFSCGITKIGLGPLLTNTISCQCFPHERLLTSSFWLNSKVNDRSLHLTENLNRWGEIVKRIESWIY
jgi:hypothetical protein